MQRALVEVLMLAGLGGVLGSWIVLRRLAFFTHGVGTAAFPGLVAAGPLGIAPQLVALGAALLYAGALQPLATPPRRGARGAPRLSAGALDPLTRSRRIATDVATGLLLVAALALGSVL